MGYEAVTVAGSVPDPPSEHPSAVAAGEGGAPPAARGGGTGGPDRHTRIVTERLTPPGTVTAAAIVTAFRNSTTINVVVGNTSPNKTAWATTRVMRSINHRGGRIRCIR